MHIHTYTCIYIHIYVYIYIHYIQRSAIIRTYILLVRHIHTQIWCA